MDLVRLLLQAVVQVRFATMGVPLDVTEALYHRLNMLRRPFHG